MFNTCKSLSHLLSQNETVVLNSTINYSGFPGSARGRIVFSICCCKQDENLCFRCFSKRNQSESLQEIQRWLVCQDPSIPIAREYDRAADKFDTTPHTSDIWACSSPLQMALVLHRSRSASDLLLRVKAIIRRIRGRSVR